jgi:hypothetical protein
MTLNTPIPDRSQCTNVATDGAPFTLYEKRSDGFNKEKNEVSAN